MAIIAVMQISMSLHNQAQFITMKFECTDDSFGLNYKIFEHAALGLNYNYFELDVTVDKSDWRGNVETTYDGLYAYVSVFFQ